ncbi:MAG: hypothetical protein LBC09_07275 [Helicobacteraceae bacterium]|jgi:hypothetical protein|nr:hypothetical protein [Helicobacteraceae bacterium]
MRFCDFFGDLFRADKRIDFYAKIFAALIASIDRKIDDAGDRIKSASEALFSGKKDRSLFAELTRGYIAGCAKNETSLNQLARKIAQLGKLYPSWSADINMDALLFAKADNEGLQDRMFEFIENLKAESTKTEGEESEIL